MKTLRSRAAASFAVLGALAMTATPALAHGLDEWHRHDGAASELDSGQARIQPAGYSGTPDSPTSDDRAYGEGISPNDPGASIPDNAPSDDRGYEDNFSRDDAPADAPESAAPGDQAGRSGETRDDRRIGNSFDAAVDACGSEIERGDHRIGSVDSVRRLDDRYDVEGRLRDGRGFACSIDDNGQIRSLDIDGHALT